MHLVPSPELGIIAVLPPSLLVIKESCYLLQGTATSEQQVFWLTVLVTACKIRTRVCIEI